jgi:rubredoxin
LELLIKRIIMKDYVCTVRGYIYEPRLGDPDAGIKAGTAFEEIPQDWECPDCGSSKEDFEELEE